MNPQKHEFKNHLLSVLPEDVLERWRANLEQVHMPLGAVLSESGSKPAYAYFPEDAIVSMLIVLENGASAEIAVVGFEGMVGISLFMGGYTTPSRAVIQSEGKAYRVCTSFIQEEFSHSLPVMHLFLRFTQALITQMTQTAVCNRHHALDQQVCRRLLLSLDRLPGPDLVMTQEFMANMLGVRREGVTDVAGRLQKARLISYTRGRIKVTDRPGLEQRACECYAVVKNEYDRLLPDLIAS